MHTAAPSAVTYIAEARTRRQQDARLAELREALARAQGEVQGVELALTALAGTLNKAQVDQLLRLYGQHHEARDAARAALNAYQNELLDCYAARIRTA